MSVNSLVSRSLRKLVEWDAHAEKFGFVTVPGALLTRLLELLTEEQAAELGRWAGTNVLREYIVFWFKEVTLDTARKALVSLASRYDRPFQYEEHVDNGHFTLVIYHGGGPRGSSCYGEMIRVLLEDLLDLNPTVECTQNEVIARFRDEGAVAAERPAAAGGPPAASARTCVPSRRP